LFEAVFASCGYKASVLEKATKDDIETGLKYINNDACYPSVIVAGQLVNAFISGRCDPSNTSVMITQTGGGCRATNYIAFLRKALVQAGFPDVAVISLSMTGIEENPGFSVTPKLLHNLIRSCVLGDLLMTLSLRTRPYELKKGESDRTLKMWIKKIHIIVANNKLLPNFRKMINSIISDFDKIELSADIKPRVGIVGEILVKFHPDANNNLIKVIESEGGEAIVPSLLDFFLYCLYNVRFRHEHLGMSAITAGMLNTVASLTEACRTYMRNALLKNPKFAGYAPVKIKDIAEKAEKILRLGHCTGEGWLLTGEMIELIEKNIPNIVCVQPFACLPNHVTGKGMIKAIRRKFEDANIVTVDYDPGASEVNQLNRIKLMIEVAFEKLNKNTDAGEETEFILYPTNNRRNLPGLS
ncbi:MAG: 2-hydroxyacyl-CoA dehydratase, partial [Oscillospiraceae bacterium]|nr:2-hydroxyacyl-CoA dehydratase [Oscillospiraceae bacterium]